MIPELPCSEVYLQTHSRRSRCNFSARQQPLQCSFRQMAARCRPEAAALERLAYLDGVLPPITEH
jgi:hypothetical protein